MHTAVYRMRPDVKSVVHCHAPYCTAYAQANKPIVNKISPEFVALFGIVPVVPYGTPGTEDIYKGMNELLQEYDVVLLANHGVLAVGKDPMDAYSKTLSLEMLLQTDAIRRQITDGNETYLSEEEYAKLMEMGKNLHGNPARFK